MCDDIWVKSLNSLMRLRPLLRPYRGLIIGSLLLAIPLAALRTLPAFLIKYVLDDVFKNHDPTNLQIFPLLVIGLYLLNFLIRFWHYYFIRIVIARVAQKIKNNLFEHLLGLSADYFSAQRNGVLISRVASDVQYIEMGISMLNVVVREPFTFIFLLGYAFTLNWRLTLITFLLFPPLTWVFATTARNLKRYLHRMNEENAGLYATLQESFAGIRIVKTFGLEKYVHKKFRERSAAFAHFVLKTAVMEEASHPMVELLSAFLIAAIIYFGGWDVLHGRMSEGQLFAFFGSFALMMNPLRSMNDLNMKVSQAAAASDRIFEVLDWKSHLVEPLNPAPFRGFEKEIVLNNIHFAYPDTPGREVLKGVSFTVPKGRVIALVGASGAGKSSLVNLIPRIFDVTGGSIEIDGRNITEYSLEDLRKQIAVVTQDVFLFNDTIEENIRCGRLSATHDEVIEAAQRAHATDFINATAEGFASIIGDRGQKLSGGERQRISIARAFLRNAPILILDEATSSLDSASERAVQSALDELMEGKTAIVIAHRLSTIRHADQIFVLKEGLITEHGRHDDLMKLNGEYAKFHQLHQ